jgi:hypothetical protein
VFEIEDEGQSEEAPSLLLIVLILAIRDVSASSEPADSMIQRVLSAVLKDLHSRIIQRVWLQKVNDVELIAPVLSRIGDLKIEPLGVLICIVICLQDEVILVLRLLKCSSKVAGFKSRFKY